MRALRWGLGLAGFAVAVGGCTEPCTCATDDTDEPSDTPEDTPLDSDTPPPEDASDRVFVTASGVRVCADPAARSASKFDVLSARPQPLPVPGEYRLKGGAVVVADFTGDNRYDVFLPGVDAAQFHVQGLDARFTDEFSSRFQGVDLTDATSATAFDVDADNDLDLFVTRWEKQNVLLLNTSTGRFTDATAAYGLNRSNHYRSQSAAFGDIDRDGDFDLVIGNYGPKPEDAHVPEPQLVVGDPSEIWRNNGDGTFTDISDTLPPEIQRAHTFLVAFRDFDVDGYDDLIFVNDFGWSRPTQVFWNRPGGLEMADASLGFARPFAGMGLGVGDLNNDEVPDLVQSSWRETSLLISDGGAWWETAQAAGILPDWDGEAQQIFGWGTDMADMDNDGDLDILMNFGTWEEYGDQPAQRDALYLQTGDVSFTESAASWGIADEGVSRGLVVTDLNDDGWPDVMKRILDGRTPMYLSRCGNEAWLRFRTTMASTTNTFAVGTRIRIVHQGRVWNRTVTTHGSGMYGSYHPEVHFGLGALDRVDLVEFYWPDGRYSTLRDVDTRQVFDVQLRPAP
jgi:hypothetical protein